MSVAINAARHRAPAVQDPSFRAEYLEALQLIERLHRMLLDVIKDEFDRVGGYDPLTGKELWYVDIPGFSNVTRPVFGHGLIYLATGFMKPEFWAIRPGGHGDVTATRGDAAHHARGDDILAGCRVDHGFQDLADGRFADFRHIRSGRPRLGRSRQFSVGRLIAAGPAVTYMQRGLKTKVPRA